MDGNNRWSKKNKFSRYSGYEKGAKNLISLTNYIFDNTDIRYVSSFALSKNNLKRSKSLISTLKKLLFEFLNVVINDNINKNFNIRFIGDKSFLNSEINQKINQLERKKKYTNKYLFIYINYSGIDDINQAAMKYLLSKEKKNKNNFEDFLMTNTIPDPEILIRTGGYSRLSDFIIYKFTFTELFFVKKLWPDFKNNDLLKIIKKYYTLERKFGL